MGRRWGSFALDVSAKWDVTDEDMRQASEDNSAPRKWDILARPSDILLRDQRCRQLCLCVECQGPMPHHTDDMICTRCTRQLEAELALFDSVRGENQ